MIQFNEKLESKKILQLLSRSLPYYLKSWQEINNTIGLFGNTNPTTFNMKDVGTSSPVIEYVVLPHINILCILSAYLYKDDFNDIESVITKNEIIDHLNKGFLWLCETHLTGSRDVDSFLERKRWGENWRSGKWAALMGICAFLCKDVLQAGLFKRVQDIIAFEADRFIDVLPPSGFEYDTKLEENAEDTMVISWAIALMPQHPHVKQWKQSLNIWAINIASSPGNRADHSEHLDKSVAYWTITQTLHPDLTAENHGFFNPEIFSYGIWIVLSMAAFRFNKRRIPSILQRRIHQETFDILLRFCLPNGLKYAPCCTDLPLFIPHPFALAWGLWNNDPRARRMTTYALNWMDTKLQPSRGTDVPWIPGFKANYEGWELFFQSQVGFELAMLAVMPFPKEHRFYSIGQIEGAIDTSHIYPYIQVCYRRNTRTTRSVAWKALSKHPIVGLNIHSYPELLVPYKANLLGIPSTDEKIKSWDVAFHYDYIKKSGFDSFGRIYYFDSLNQKVMHRDIRVLTWGDDGIVIFDRIFADKELHFQEQYLSPVYLVNDIWTKNKIILTSGSLKEIIHKERVIKRHLSCPSFWASIEGSMLFQFIWGRSKGLTYIPGNKPNAPRYWNNCRLDMLGVYIEGKKCIKGDIAYEIGYFIGAGKAPRPFKSAGNCQDFFKGIVVMDGKNTVGLD
jgi:hypothetical protein